MYVYASLLSASCRVEASGRSHKAIENAQRTGNPRYLAGLLLTAEIAVDDSNTFPLDARKVRAFFPSRIVRTFEITVADTSILARELPIYQHRVKISLPQHRTPYWRLLSLLGCFANSGSDTAKF